MIVSQPPIWYLDRDNDGYYLNGSALTQCNSPGGFYKIVIIAGGDCNDTNVLINPGVAEICYNNIDDNCNGFVDEGCTISLNLKLFLEGMYLGGDSMLSSDTIKVDLRYAFSPYNIAWTSKDIIQQNGLGIFLFPAAVFNNNYYIVIQHRNAIETWTKFPVLFNSAVISYDFSRY